ncbi:hypothetical protein [Megasphaera hominis]|jgi:multidrug efflux pump subunit AcrB|uniref:Uncharacterized protein n=1 Tax=Megasphaera hominis TaxID=159836 RepID=A0ABR6VLA5_9FIRM|nr:hypothetical protein [Megasphaera hominis]MBC3537532.1 hypothetical protein [Megasphaera hominis]
MAGFFEKHGEALVVAIIAACAFGYYQHFVVPKQIEEAVNASQRNADAVLTNALQQQQGQISILNQKLKDYENGQPPQVVYYDEDPDVEFLREENEDLKSKIRDLEDENSDLQSENDSLEADQDWDDSYDEEKNYRSGGRARW